MGNHLRVHQSNLLFSHLLPILISGWFTVFSFILSRIENFGWKSTDIRQATCFKKPQYFFKFFLFFFKFQSDRDSFVHERQRVELRLQVLVQAEDDVHHANCVSPDQTGVRLIDGVSFILFYGILLWTLDIEYVF